MTYEEAQDAVRANPDDAGAWFVLGTLEEEAERTEQAGVSYRRALTLDPLMQEALNALTHLQEERVLAQARSSLAEGGVEAVYPTAPTYALWPLLALVVLFLAIVGLLYVNFGGLVVMPVTPTPGVLEADILTPAVASPPPTSPTATLEPTLLAPTTTLPVTPTIVSASDLLERVAAAEADLYSGHFQATTRFSANTHSSAQVRFDLGRTGEAPRFHLITTYDAPQSSQTTEYVIIGEQAWQRVERGAWVETVEQEGVLARIRRYLPQNESVMDAVVETGDEWAELQWQDSNRALEVTLRVDSTTAIPLELHEAGPEGEPVTSVRYEAWNTPVEIEPPS